VVSCRRKLQPVSLLFASIVLDILDLVLD